MFYVDIMPRSVISCFSVAPVFFLLSVFLFVPSPVLYLLTPPGTDPSISVFVYIVFVLPQVLVSSFPQPLSSSVLLCLDSLVFIYSALFV